MKILVVGAGAVGQVYGYYLQAGGAQVTYYVRPKYVDELKRGLVLYPRNQHKDFDHPVRLTGYGVISSQDQVRAEDWDYVVLCTHAGAVHTPWFDEFAPAARNAVLVNLSPDLEGRKAISRYFPEERQINGLIALISYFAPLPGEQVTEPGVAFWFPPLTQIPFQGAEARVEPLIEVFRRGHFPCKHLQAQGDTQSAVAADIILSVFVLALEGAGWRFSSFLAPSQAALTRSAILETLEVECRVRGLGAPKTTLLKLLLSRFGLRALLLLAQWLMPFDLETYLRVHFTKVRDQRQAGLAQTFGHAGKLGIATPALQNLAGQV